jgi:predicted nucleotidyltransferase
MDAVARASRFVAEHHPRAVAAFLGGSHARGAATATSDLDVVVVDPDVEWAYRRTWRFADVKVEAFCYRDLDVLVEWLAGQRAKRQPTLHSFVAESIVLLADGAALRVRDVAAQELAAGPGPLSPAQRDQLRHHPTDLHDDLGDLAAAELPAFSAVVAVQLLATICDAHDHWVGKGKWLRRYAARLEPDLTDEIDRALVAAAGGDRAPLLAASAAVLALVGGRLDETGALVAERPGPAPSTRMAP